MLHNRFYNPKLTILHNNHTLDDNEFLLNERKKNILVYQTNNSKKENIQQSLTNKIR